MSAKPCRLCYGTGVRYIADHPDHLSATPCPCLDTYQQAYADE